MSASFSLMAWVLFASVLRGGSIHTSGQVPRGGDLPHLKASTDLVRVDVVVIDRDGKIAPDPSAPPASSSTCPTLPAAYSRYQVCS